MNIWRAPHVTWKNKYLLHPEHPIRIVWELIMFAILLVSGFIVPYLLAFEESNLEFSDGFDIFTMVIYSIDIIVNLNTGFYQEGEIVKDRKKILKQYSKIWLWVDLFSAIPLSLIISSSNNRTSSAFKLFYIVRILKLLKLLKLMKIGKVNLVFTQLQEHSASYKIVFFLKIFQLLLFLVLIAHFYSCMLLAVSEKDLSPNGFIASLNRNSEDFVFSNSELYISALYFVFATMCAIGYGDITLETTTTRILGIFIMLSSCCIFGVIIGNIGEKIEKEGKDFNKKREIMVSLNVALKHYKISNELKGKCRRYLDYINNNVNTDKESVEYIISIMPESIQREMIKYTEVSVLKKCEIFKMFSDENIQDLFKELKIQIYCYLDGIIREGQRPEGIYFIIEGIIEVYDLKSSKPIKYLSKDQYFGEIGFFTRKHCISSVSAGKFCQILFLSVHSFEKFVETHKKYKSTLKKIKKDCKNDDFSSLGVHCYICKELGHIAKHCKAIINDKASLTKWALSRKSGKLINPLVNKKPNFERIFRYTKKNDYSIRKVLGKKRKIDKMFPKERKFTRMIREYYDNTSSLLDESKSLFTENSCASYQLIRREDQVKLILSSEDEMPPN